jgi:hypothetical protein
MSMRWGDRHGRDVKSVVALPEYIEPFASHPTNISDVFSRRCGRSPQQLRQLSDIAASVENAHAASFDHLVGASESLLGDRRVSADSQQR